jgi:hypothetical protein
MFTLGSVRRSKDLLGFLPSDGEGGRVGVWACGRVGVCGTRCRARDGRVALLRDRRGTSQTAATFKNIEYEDEFEYERGGLGERLRGARLVLLECGFRRYPGNRPVAVRIRHDAREHHRFIVPFFQSYSNSNSSS